jgi:broad specificity phosphatase PhoE
MKKVYFVRHGESDANAGGIIKPENEVALTELGHQQAAFMGERAKKLDAQVIVASTLLRAHQTAGYIQEATGLPMETSPLFIERRYPSGQHGLTLEHPSIKDINHILERRFGDEDAKHSDEETFEEIKERTAKAFEYLKNRPEENILVVTHGIFLRMVVGYALFGEKLTRRDAGNIVNVFKTKNTGISFLEYDEEKNPDYPWIIRTWNDHAHLG